MEPVCCHCLEKVAVFSTFEYYLSGQEWEAVQQTGLFLRYVSKRGDERWERDLLCLGETGPERAEHQLCFARIFQLERLWGRYCLHGYRAIWINLEIATSRLQNINRRTQTDPWGTLLVTSVQPDLV